MSKVKNNDNNIMPKVKGIPFYCYCGCNIFHQVSKEELTEREYSKNLYIIECNACEAWYEGI